MLSRPQTPDCHRLPQTTQPFLGHPSNLPYLHQSDLTHLDMHHARKNESRASVNTASHMFNYRLAHGISAMAHLMGPSYSSHAHSSILHELLSFVPSFDWFLGTSRYFQLAILGLHPPWDAFKMYISGVFSRLTERKTPL